jgi:hypothetical protein
MLSLGFFIFLLLAILTISASARAAERPLAIATFQIDATPPLGSPLCGGGVAPAKKIVDPLSARGVVFLTRESPIVLCAVDWVGIGNGGHDEWRRALAEAAGTTSDRVSVHTVHQHDAPGCDFSAEELLEARGIGGAMFDADFARDTIAQAAEAVRRALENPRQVTHLGIGKAKVEKVASNRRVLGPNGAVAHVRYSSCRNEAARAAPEGVIDPYVRNLSFWDGDRSIASLTYYATHPQSFYGRGAVSTDFVGMARAIREATLPEIVHIHFNGAGGNVAAGKYNDGSPTNRLVLAQRLVEGMEAAWEATVKIPITTDDIDWRVRSVALPLRDRLLEGEEELLQTLDNPEAELRARIRAARDLVWTRRCKTGHRIDLTCLRLGAAYVLHMPGELFVEYQLAAQEMVPDDTVCVAAYGDYGPGYIGTEISYSQGGYETGVVSRVAPEVEEALMEGLGDLFEVSQ